MRVMMLRRESQFVKDGSGGPARRLDLVVGREYRAMTVEDNGYRWLGESGGP